MCLNGEILYNGFLLLPSPGLGQMSGRVSGNCEESNLFMCEPLYLFLG